jgi:hypothetical protein
MYVPGWIELVLPQIASSDENALLLKSRELTADYGTWMVVITPASRICRPSAVRKSAHR